MDDSPQACVQGVFLKHFESSADLPISRNELIDAGWNQYAFLTYYRVLKLFYFAYRSCWHRHCLGLQCSSDSKEYFTSCKDARFILEKSGEELKNFFHEAVEISLDDKACLNYIEDYFLYENNNGIPSFQSFASVLESFVGKQLALQKVQCDDLDVVSNNIRNLFVDYRRGSSRNYFECRSVIPKKEFLASGWTMETYQRYYNLTSDLYFSLMLRQNQYAQRFVGWYWDRNNPLKDEAERNFTYILNEFSAFIKRYLQLTLKKTKDYNYIFSAISGVYWCTPFDDQDDRYDTNMAPPKKLVFFATYDQFLSWIEYEIGDQILNSPQESEENNIGIEIYKPPVDADWYKLTYSELREYRIHTTEPTKECLRNKLLSFDDFNSPDSDERLQKLAFDFIEWERIDEDVSERLEEYEYGEFNKYGDTLYIYKGETKCFREHHEIKSVTATVLARRGNTADININCCCDCHKYFISEAEFLHYRNLYGIVCGLKIDRHSSGYAKIPMAEHSILRLYGYNVGKQENLSDIERRDLLRTLVEHRYITKPEIIKYLEMFIKMNRNRIEMADSVCKWTDDLAYIRNFGLEDQEKVLVEKIKYAY